MEKEFVPYEQAIVLKELGFDEPCIACYVPAPTWMKNKTPIIRGYFINEFKQYFNSKLKVENVSAPTFSQAFKWFREKYSLHSIFEYDSDNYYYVIQGINDFNLSIDSSEDGDVHQTYEQAELECLRKLIEIVKS